MRKRMGTFYTNCRVEIQVDRKKSADVPKMLGDTGAEFTWINAETLKKIGVKREKKDYTFVMANGQQITRAVGFAIIRVGDALTTDEVIFGEPGDLQILGARSLEGMNLRVDSRTKKLVRAGPSWPPQAWRSSAGTQWPMRRSKLLEGSGSDGNYGKIEKNPRFYCVRFDLRLPDDKYCATRCYRTTGFFNIRSQFHEIFVPGIHRDIS